MFNSFNDGIAEFLISKFYQVEMLSVVVLRSKAICFVNPIMVLFDIIYGIAEIGKHCSLMSSFTPLILFLMLASLKSWGRSPVMYMFVMLFLFLIIKAEDLACLLQCCWSLD